MVCVSWLLVPAAVSVLLSQGVGALCWDTTLCDGLGSKERILDCLLLCTSQYQAMIPGFSSSAQQSDEDSHPLDVLLTDLANGAEAVQPEPQDQEQDQKRRSYSMEHFRWGKPAGHKRRPLKVYPPTPEGAELPEGGFPRQTRRQEGAEAGGRGGAEPLRVENEEAGEGEPELVALWGPREKKDGSYQMAHFRWGRPPVAKRYGGFMKASQKPLLNLFRNVIVKDAK